MKPFPRPLYRRKDYRVFHILHKAIRRTETLAQAEKLVQFDPGNSHADIEGEKMAAYLLLKTLQPLMLEIADGVDMLNREEVVERLLICGTYADPTSMISSEAFRLARAIIAPEQSEVDPEIRPHRYNRYRPLIEKYAVDMIWPLVPTPQAIAGLAVFYDHKYSQLPNFGEDQQVNDRTQIEFHPTGDESVPLFTPDLSGVTPLEFYSYLVLDDPPFRDQLIYRVTRLIELRRIDVKVLRDNRPSENVNEWLIELCKQDTFFYRFFTTKIKVTREKKGEPNREVTVIQALSELLPCHDQQALSSLSMSRACLNGFFWKMLLFLVKSSEFMDGVSFVWDTNLIPQVDPKTVAAFAHQRPMRKSFAVGAPVPTGGSLEQLLKSSPPANVYDPEE